MKFFVTELISLCTSDTSTISQVSGLLLVAALTGTRLQNDVSMLEAILDIHFLKKKTFPVKD